MANPSCLEHGNKGSRASVLSQGSLLLEPAETLSPTLLHIAFTHRHINRNNVSDMAATGCSKGRAHAAVAGRGSLQLPVNLHRLLLLRHLIQLL